MHIAYVYNEVPNCEFSTDTYCAFLLVRMLKEAGHRVSLVLLLPEKNLIVDRQTRSRWLRDLDILGVEVTIFPGDIAEKSDGIFSKPPFLTVRRLFFGRLDDYFPHVQLAKTVEPILKTLSPDLIFVWGNWPPLAAVHGIRLAPKFAFVGDPPHAPRACRIEPPFVDKKNFFSFQGLIERLYITQLAQMTVQLLSECAAVACTSAYHAEWFRSHGLRHCKQLPNIIPDWGGQDWKQKRAAARRNDKFKIVLLGNLLSTSNFSGLHCFAHEVLPALTLQLGKNFEVHVCGRGELPRELASRMNSPNVYMRGFVDDIISELFSSDIFLVPTPIKLGIRVRIPYAWSTGACVVAHSANAAGLVELEHEKNALLSASGVGLANQIVCAFKDRELAKRLGEEGRKTYETHFSYDVTCKKILAEFEQFTKSEKG